MKFNSTGRPSFISCGSDTTLPSSRVSITAGTAYCTVCAFACCASAGEAMPVGSPAGARAGTHSTRAATRPAPMAGDLLHHQTIDTESPHDHADVITRPDQVAFVGKDHPIG